MKLRFVKSISPAGVSGIAVPLPGPGSVLKKYSAALMMGALNVKLVLLVTFSPLTVTRIGPVVVPGGTVTVMLFAVLAVTVAATPLNVTVLLAGVVLKLAPLITTVLPTFPPVGEKLVMVGGDATAASTKKFLKCVCVHWPSLVFART